MPITDPVSSGLLSPQMGNFGSERVSKAPKVTQLPSCGLGFQLSDSFSYLLVWGNLNTDPQSPQLYTGIIMCYCSQFIVWIKHNQQNVIGAYRR